MISYWIATVCLCLFNITPAFAHHVALQMNGYTTSKSDEYVGIAFPAPAGYVVSFEPLADADRVHHMFVHGCTVPYNTTHRWVGGAVCRSGHKILFAWGRNAEGFKMPEGTAFSVGHSEDIVQYLVIQIHYAHSFVGRVRDYSGVRVSLIHDRPRRLAGILVFATATPIPPALPAFFTNSSCSYKSPVEIYPIAFRTHTHEMGRVVSGYFLHQGKWNLIGKRNPIWPQASGFSLSILVFQVFQPIENNIVVRDGDLLAMTCRFDSSQKTKITPMGSMHNNEMCNYYLMYAWNSTVSDPFEKNVHCFGRGMANKTTEIPAYPESGKSLMPARPDLEEHARQHTKPFGVLERKRMRKIENHLGQIAGLAFDPIGNLVVFHRGPRIWSTQTFDDENRLFDRTPIEDETILIVQPPFEEPFRLLKKTGANSFYIPHGIFVDAEGAIYTTDVGSHQVGKWRLQNDNFVNEFLLGERFVPGTDSSHFCKPTSVSVSPGDGAIFVADGYCNNRILKFTKSGAFVSEFELGASSNMVVSADFGSITLPQDIVIDKEKGVLFVADRLNGRVQSFLLDGTPAEEISNNNITNVYSVDVHGDTVYFIPGETESDPIEAFAASRSLGLISFSWQPRVGTNFQSPQIIRVSPDGQSIFIGEALIDKDGQGGQGLLWRFELQKKGIDWIETDRSRWDQLGLSKMLEQQDGRVQLEQEITDEMNTNPFFFFAAVLLVALLWRWRRFLKSSNFFDRKKTHYSHDEIFAFLRPKSKL